MSMKKQTWKAAVSAAAICVAAASPSLADTNTWTGAENANALNANNWLNVAGESVLPGAADIASIGDAPEAVLAGTASWSHLWLGTQSGKTGAMTVGSGGTLTVTEATSGALSMGNVNGSAGVFTIDGGDVTIETLNTPNFAATSTVHLISGTLTINDWADWGRNAKGLATFNQSGGTLDLKKNLEIGRANNGTGIYNMNGGVLNGAVGSTFVVGGREANCIGTFNLTDGTVTFGSKDVRFATHKDSKGYFNQSGGTVSSTGILAVGYNGTGSYTISGGAFTSTANMNLGATSGASGTVTQDGGIVTVKDVRVGHASGATGHYTLNAGTIMISTGWMQIGPAGTGKFVQNGGELQINNGKKMQIADTATGDGQYIINGGLCSVDGDDIVVGRLGKGLFVMNGGTVAAKKINSGTAATGQGRVLLNGGTLKATAAGTLFAKGNVTTNDWTIGRDFTVDTNGKNVSSGIASFKATSGSSFTKEGDGTLTMASLPCADSVTVAKGTLSLTSGGDNTKSAALAHRWSFNGSANDSAGGATGTLVGSVVYTNDSKSVYLAGGANGTSYVNLGRGILVGDNLTLEFWAERVSVKRWGRVFECGIDQSNFVTVSWVRSTNASQNKLAVKYGAVEQNQTDKMAFTDGERIHFAVRFRKNANGTTTITWVKRNPATGEVVNTSDFTPTGLDEGWTLDKVAEGNFNLGHTDVWTSDNDANAIYDEVRVWHGALSDEALTLSAQKGPDATAEDIAAIVAKNDETATVERTLKIASGATLNLGGNTLTQPVVKGNGTITTGAGGSLVVTDKMVVKVGECIEASGTIDLSNAKIELVDPENLASPFTFLKPANGQALTVIGTPTPANLPRGWKVSVSANGTGRIVKRGFMIIVK